MLNILRRLPLVAIFLVTPVLAHVASPIAASAYALENAYWYTDANSNTCGQQTSLSWNSCSLGIYLDSSVTSRGSTWTGSILAAGNDWYTWDRSRNRLDWQFFSDPSASTSNHETVYASDLGQCNPGGTCTVGQSTIFKIPGVASYGMIVSASLKVNTNSTINYCYSSTPCSGVWVCMECVVAHEFGHGMGLDHPAQGPHAGMVMQCVLSSGEYQLPATDDFNGIYHYYSGHPNDFPSPGPTVC